MSLKRVEDLAENIAMHEFGFKKAPVDVKKIARARGLVLIEEALDDGVAGLLITQGNQSFCVLNRSNSPNRKRFTIGHELGHLILKHQQQSGEHVHVDRGNFISARGPRAAEGVDPKEIEANRFAACLLMPAPLVNQVVSDMGGYLTDDKVSEMADLFSVSEQAMTIRLIALGHL